MATPRRIPINAIPEVLNGISTQLPAVPDQRLGAFIADVVRNQRKLESFRDSPERELKSDGISTESLDLRVLTEVVEAINSKIVRPGGVADTVTQKESSSSQDRNFDNSASWGWNKDGYNVIYDQGHSSEKTTGEMVGQDAKFSGLGVEQTDLNVINEMLGKVFFPSQPLVTPELIEYIKESARRG